MRKSLQFIFHFMWNEKKFFLFGVTLTALVSTLTWLGPKIIAYLIDEGLVVHRSEVLLKGVIFLACAELTRLLCVFGSQVCYAKLGQNVIERVRGRMVNHLLKLPIPFFDSVTSGGMMTRLVSDVNSLQDFFQSGFVSVLGNFASVCAIFIGLFSLNFTLGLILLLAFLPIAVLCVFFSNRLKGIYELTRNRLSELNSKLADVLFGMRTVRALGLSERKYSEVRSQIDSYSSAQMKMVGTFALFHPVLSLGTGVLLLILIARGIPLVASGTFGVGEWVAALSYVVLLQQPLVEISDRWNFFLAGLTSIERIQETLDELPEPSGAQLAESFETIRFEKVGFTYAGSQKSALEDVSFCIQKGDWLGVHGESGSGKSTFLQMLYGFYSATSGTLSWSEKDYKSINLASLRKHFGVVEQFPFLFHATIRENITLFGEHDLNLESLAQTFRGYSLIESIFKILDFEVSERGENLSMGQKQMITFLRAYLAKPSIWILDEATAFFDPEAEQEVLRALTALRPQEITVIQVAHRPEALTDMKRIIEIKDGHLLEIQRSS